MMTTNPIPIDPVPIDDGQLFDLLDSYVAALQAGDREYCARWQADHPHLVELAQCLDLLGNFRVPENCSEKRAGEADVPLVDCEATVIKSCGCLDAAATGPLAGLARNFGKYELLEEIGRGGMGVVFKARQSDLNRIVALKMILSNQLAADAEVKRFYREARAAGSLRHPHIVGIHEVGEIDGQHYFAMDFIAGTSMAGLTRFGPLESERAAQLLIGVARAVQFLHDHGIVHRDLKPSNILLDAAGTPLVTDFGLAKVFDDQDERTQSGTMLGTPGYMPPEQAAGRISEISPRSDVYGLGAILYEALTGRPPFREDTPHRTILQVLESEPTLPVKLNPRLPAELERICLKCLEKDPSRRYGSATEVADELDRFLRHEPIEARPAGIWARMLRWLRRETGLASRLAIMFVAILVTQAEHYFSHRDLSYHWDIKLAFASWALLAVIFQWFLRREKTAEFARLGWAVTDPLFLLYVLKQADEIETILVGYPVIIAASGLWFRERLVLVSTASCIASYGALLAIRREAISLVHYPVIFMTALAVIGGVVAFQVQRVRTLSRYFEQTKPDV
jgi:serine/threonine-protein kinase